MNETQKRLFNANHDFKLQKEFQDEYFGKEEKVNASKRFLKNFAKCGVFVLIVLGLVSMFF